MSQFCFMPELRAQTPPKKNCKLDTDQDGINDCFDRCDHTPVGIRVDSHGCPRDTDADGVPDYKDKQLITPTECQPTDTLGIGKCPEPAPTNR
jgi:hypothetical protein